MTDLPTTTFRSSRLGGGACEIAVKREDKLVAVITHPCVNAWWFFHPAGFKMKLKFPTRKAAIQYATTFEG